MGKGKAARMARTPEQLMCSFCGKRQDQVWRLIAGPGRVYICDQCVGLCNEILAQNPPLAPGQETQPAAPACGLRHRAETPWWRRLHLRSRRMEVGWET